MAPRRRTSKRPTLPNVGPAETGLTALSLQFIAWQETLLSESSVLGRLRALSLFLSWCAGRGVGHASELNRSVLQSYVEMVDNASNSTTGAPLSMSTKLARFGVMKYFCRWLTVHGHLPQNPMTGLRLESKDPGPRPQPVLTAEEAERVLALPDVATMRGLRDRALLEVLYSTGVRRQELIELKLSDVNWSAGTVQVREGKWRRDRVAPVGERALRWLNAYVHRCRQMWVRFDEQGVLFVTDQCKPLDADALSFVVRDLLDRAGIRKRGSCHLFRRSMAAGMLEGGAKLVDIQAMLGHTQLSTTTLYTPISFEALQRVHQQCHPSEVHQPAAIH